MKKNRKYLLGLIALVIVAMLGTIGGTVFLAQADTGISNTLTLGGTVTTPPAPVITYLTLAWVSVAGGAPSSGTATTVTWVVGTPYIVDVSATNNENPASGIYGKLTGWDKTKLTLEFKNPAAGNAWTDLGSITDPIAGYCGFFVGTTYYFGPKGGDSYTASQTKPFEFKITPLAAGSLDITLTLVNGVTDTRP